MKFLVGLRFLLEVLGISFICFGVLLWFFPGAWRGLGIAAALEQANKVATATGAVPNPIASPADLMALMLTLVTIILAVLAIMVGAFAFFGWAEVRKQATETARNHAEAASNNMTVRFKELEADIRESFVDFRKTLFAEFQEGQGLAEGRGADEIAQASGNPPTEQS
jgi:hypothetical protein